MEGLRIVQKANQHPGKCCFSLDTQGPFLDAGKAAGCHNPHLYLSVRWFKEVAERKFGMVSREEIKETLDSFKAKLAEQDEELAELRSFVAASVEYEEAKEKLSPLNGHRRAA